MGDYTGWPNKNHTFFEIPYFCSHYRYNHAVFAEHTHTHTTVLLLFWNLSGTTRVSRYQKGKTRKVKTNLDLLEQEIVSDSVICWAICKSAPQPRQPRQHPTTQFFTGGMPFLPPNQQRQSTEGSSTEGSVFGELFRNYSRKQQATFF